jgi:hypothetical protein
MRPDKGALAVALAVACRAELATDLAAIDAELLALERVTSNLGMYFDTSAEVMERVDAKLASLEQHAPGATAGATIRVVVAFCLRGGFAGFTGNISQPASLLPQQDRAWASSVAHLTELASASVSAGIELTVVDKSCGTEEEQAKTAVAVAGFPASVEYIKVPNIGRETTAYLTAIWRMSNSSNIANHTLFLQEDYPFMEGAGPDTSTGLFHVGHPGDTLKTVQLIVEHYMESLKKPPYANSPGGKHYVALHNMGAGSLPGLGNILLQNKIRNYWKSRAEGGHNSTESDASECASVLWEGIVSAHADRGNTAGLPTTGSRDLPASWRETKSSGCCAYFGTSKPSIAAFSTDFWARLLRTAVASANEHVTDLREKSTPDQPNCWPFFLPPPQGVAGHPPCAGIASAPASDHLCRSAVLSPWAFEGIWGPLFGDFEGRGTELWSPPGGPGRAAAAGDDILAQLRAWGPTPAGGP